MTIEPKDYATLSCALELAGNTFDQDAAIARRNHYTRLEQQFAAQAETCRRLMTQLEEL